ncbi:hypothetical protein [Halorientalis persicus]|nr:hypothetical protein [Halorientalis persicus]
MPIKSQVILDGLLVVALDPTETLDLDPDVTVQRCRNVVALGPDCQLSWVVEEPPTGDTDDYYSILSVSKGKLTAKSTDRQFHRIDTATGELVDSWREYTWREVWIDGSTISTANSRLALPLKPSMWDGSTDTFVVVVGSGTEGADDPDVSVSPPNNAIAVGPDGALRWVASGVTTLEDDYSLLKPYCLGDRIIIRSVTDHYHEFDPETGEERAVWPHDQFEFGGERFSFGSPVIGLKWCDGVTVLKTDGPNRGHELYGFADDGTQLWHRSDETRWRLLKKEGEIRLWDETTRGRPTRFRFDEMTGKIIEKLTGSG